MGGINLQQLEDRIVDLPTLPSVLARLMPLDPDADDHFEQVVAIAENDPCLSLRILQAVAVAKRSTTNDVATLAQALSTIGAAGIKRVLREQSGAQVFMPDSDAEKRLWLHSLQVAVFCRQLTKFFPQLGVNADEAYLAGLLHDAGRLIRFYHISDDPDVLEQAGFTTPDELLQVEKMITGLTHTEIAGIARRKWHLANRFTVFMEMHHIPPRELARRTIHSEPCDPKLCVKIIELIQIGDEVSLVTLQGNPLDRDRLTSVIGKYMEQKPYHLKGAKLPGDRLIAMQREMIEESNKRYNALMLGKTDYHRRLEQAM